MAGSIVNHIGLTILLAAAAIAQPQQCYTLPPRYPPTEADLPLCGNGALDPGETCDDGNRVGGDGCNAWCSQFDMLTRPCTVAGGAGACPANGRPVLSTPAQTQFCALSAVAAGSSFLILADGGSLVRMPLYQPPAALTLLPASVSHRSFTRFCYVHVMPDDDGVLAHECAQQLVLLITDAGSTLRTVAALDGLLAPAKRGLAHYDASAGELLVAGLPAQPDGTTCVLLYAVSLAQDLAPRLAGAVPCVVYNAWEGGALYTTFAVEGMAPQAVQLERCPPQMGAADCYVLSLLRGDMQQMTAYLPRAGGSDARYTVSTDDALNVLGAPQRMVSPDRALTYTLTGPCLTAQSNFATRSGQAPPSVSLGNVCRGGGWGCATPLNSPFNTDVVSSPYLLPSGLTSRHTHAQLVSIFSASQNASNAGMQLYAQVLQNALAGAAPVALAEIPATRDLVYVTPTSVALISTKGVVLNDPYNPGYCVPTRLIQCPPGQYGQVGGACAPCHADANDGTSIAAQVQCLGVPGSRRRLLSAAQQQRPPYVSTTHIVSGELTKIHFDTLAAYLMLHKGFDCPAADASALTSHQPFNGDADYALAAANGASPPQQPGAVERLMAIAQQQGGAQVTMQVPDEYTVTLTTQHLGALSLATRSQIAVPVNDSLLLTQCAPATLVARADGSREGLADALSACDHLVNKPIARVWMPCAVKALLAWAGPAAGTPGRRLLAQKPPVLVEQSPPTLYSDTSIIYFAPSPPSPPPPPSTGRRDAPSSSPNLILILGVVCGVTVALLVVCGTYAALSRKKSGLHLP